MVEIMILVMGVVAGALPRRRGPRGRENHSPFDAAWETFMLRYRAQQKNGEPRFVADEVVRFDQMQEQGILPPGWRWDPNLGILEPGWVPFEEEGIRHLLNPKVIVVDNSNDLETISRMIDSGTGMYYGTYHLVMHDEPNPNSPPEHRARVGTVTWPGSDLVTEVKKLEQVGVFMAKGHERGHPIGIDNGGVYTAEAIVSALRAGFILAYNSVYPDTFFVVHPWPNNIDRHDGPWAPNFHEHTGIMEIPTSQRSRDAAAREHMRLGYGLPLEEPPFFVPGKK